MQTQVFLQKLLNERLQELKLQNENYSLRAFARKLQLSPAAVSEICNGKRNVSQKMAEKIAMQLALSPEDCKKLARSFGGAKTEYTFLNTEQFHLIRKSIHFAILSLLETVDFKNSLEWMASRLKSTKAEVGQALNRLEKLSLVRKKVGPRWEVTGESFSTSDEVSSVAVKHAHCEGFDLAKASLLNDPLELRDFTAIVMAVDPKNLPKAKEKIRRFRDEMAEFLGEGEKKEVYRLAIQLFPLTDTKPRGEV